MRRPPRPTAHHRLSLLLLFVVLVVSGCGTSGSCGSGDTLFSTSEGMGGLAVDGDRLLFVVRGVPDDDFADCRLMEWRADETRELMALPAPWSPVVGDGAIYFSAFRRGELRIADEARRSSRSLVTGLRFPSQLVHWRGQLYFHDRSSPAGLKRAPVSGGAPEAVVAREHAGALGIAVDDGGVYFTEDDALLRVSHDGSGERRLASGHATSRKPVSDEDHVYWVASREVAPGDYREGILRVAKAGGPVTVLASGYTEIAALTVDDSHVYWVHDSGGLVEKVPKGGGSVVTIADDQNGPRSIVVDDARIYWTTDDWKKRTFHHQDHDGALRRSAK